MALSTLSEDAVEALQSTSGVQREGKGREGRGGRGGQGGGEGGEGKAEGSEGGKLREERGGIGKGKILYCVWRTIIFVSLHWHRLPVVMHAVCVGMSELVLCLSPSEQLQRQSRQ